MTLVEIAFLPTLSSLEPTSDLLDPLNSLEYYLITPHDSLTNLAPIDWGHTLPPIENLKGRSVYASMVAVAI